MLVSVCRRICIGSNLLISRPKGLSTASHATAKQEIDVVKKLRGVKDPVTGRALQRLGMMQSVRVADGDVHLRMDFMVPGYPREAEVKAEITRLVAELPWAKQVHFQMEPPKKCANLNSMSLQDTTLSKVGHIIGVSSCKGGVGKSTVATNLALTMAKMGLRVGLLDADIYGPSLPELLPAQNLDVQRSPSNPKHVLPLRALHCPDLRMLSFGHVNPKSGAPGAGGKSAAVVRGPIASRIINQLLLATEWGELDYLVLDMPPGTGDVQITLSQSATLSGAVMVTTPHRLALVDAAKGVAMFEELKVPTLAVVENMAHFTCEHGTQYFPFGRGGRENLLRGCEALMHEERERQINGKEQGGCGHSHHAPGESCGGSKDDGEGADLLPSSAYVRLQRCPMHSLPLIPYDVAKGTEAMLPVCIAAPESEAAQTYRALASDLLAEVFRSQVGVQLIPTISLSSTGTEFLLRYYGGASTSEYSIPVEELRLRDPMTGKVRLPEGTSAEEMKRKLTGVIPEKFDHKGQYGVAIVWSDGHFADIFPYDVLRGIAEEVAAARKAAK